jgi:hypothetical protein
VDAAWVTGEAARTLDPATGRFVLALPAGRFVSRLAAESVAVAVARSYANPNLLGNARAVLEQDRGGPIDFSRLRPCHRTTYATGPVGELPAAAPGWVRRGLGPQWAVPLCAPGRADAQLSVGVPDGGPRDFAVAGDTLARDSFRQLGGGNNWTTVGVPSRFPSGLPLTPEEAVAAVARATARRVADRPAAYDGPGKNFPLCASWRLVLDAPVRVRGDSTGRERLTSELYVRRAPACFSAAVRLYVALPAPAAVQWVRFPRDTTGRSSAGLAELDSVAAPVVGPAAFEAVTVAR